MAGGHAIALLNAGAYTTTVAFTLRDSAGNAAATSSYALKPNRQAALFHNQLSTAPRHFSSLPSDSRGTISQRL
jgi:hypothetical protein